jgi:hypothetical protein
MFATKIMSQKRERGPAERYDKISNRPPWPNCNTFPGGPNRLQGAKTPVKVGQIGATEAPAPGGKLGLGACLPLVKTVPKK